MTARDAARRRRDATVAFFAPRAAGWDEKFRGDDAAFRAAVAELDPPAGGIVLDAGCGTGRAVPHLAAAVGAGGLVLAADVTPAMLDALGTAGRRAHGQPILADAGELPLADGTVDAVFAGGLLPHTDEPASWLAELARVTRTGGRLAVFHPIGRVALAARHGRVLTGDEVLAPRRLRTLLDASGWRTLSLDDGEARYLALAERRPGAA